MAEQLSRNLSLKQLFSFGFGSIIGVGWITVMGIWLGNAGPVGAAIAFLACSILVLFIALCYADLAIEFPVTGAELTYVHETFGVRPAFAVGWLMALAYIGIVVFEFVSVGWVVEAIFPAWRNEVLYSIAGADISLAGLATGLIGTAIVGYFNITGAKASGAFQQFVTFSLIAVSIIFASLAFLNGDVQNLKPYFGGAGIAGQSDTHIHWFGFFSVFVTVPFWFGGFNIIPQAMSEKNRDTPAKAIRIVLIIAILAAAVFYALMILAAGVAAPQTVTLSADLPVKAAIDAATGTKWGGQLVLVAGLLGLFSTWNAFLYGGSRILFALGRAQLILPSMGQVDGRFATPRNALLFISILGIVGGLFGRAAVAPIVDTGAIVFSVAYFSVCLCLLKSRWINRHTTSQSAGLLLPILGVLSAVSIALAAIYLSYVNRKTVIPLEWVIFLGWLMIGFIGYWLASRRPTTLSRERRSAILLTEIKDH